MSSRMCTREGQLVFGDEPECVSCARCAQRVTLWAVLVWGQHGLGVHAGVSLQGAPPGMLQTPQMLQPPSDAPISWDGPDPWDALIPRDDPSLLGCTNPSGYSEPLGCSNPSGYSDPLGCSRPPGCSALPQDAPAPLTLGQDPAPVGTPLYPAQSWAVPGCDGARGPRQDRIPSPPNPPPGSHWHRDPPSFSQEGRI